MSEWFWASDCCCWYSYVEECYYIVAAQHLLSDVFPHQRWNWFFHLQTLQNVKTFPSALAYLVARKRFQNPLLTCLPGTPVGCPLKAENWHLEMANLWWPLLLVPVFIFFFVLIMEKSLLFKCPWTILEFIIWKIPGYLLVSIHQKLGMGLY